MTKRTLTATTAAFALLLGGAAHAQSTAVETETDTTVGAEASGITTQTTDTAETAGDAVGDAVELTLDTAGAAADSAYGAASDAAAQVDAAITADAVVQSSDGETIGTIGQTDLDGDRVVIDLDSEMENSFDVNVENVVLQARSLIAAEDALVLDMTQEEFAAAVTAKLDAEG